jgi:hypothetical protein
VTAALAGAAGASLALAWSQLAGSAVARAGPRGRRALEAVRALVDAAVQQGR